MDEDLSDKELGRRLSASRGYCRESVKEFAERINVERHDLTKWEKGEFGSKARWRLQERNRLIAIERVREASGLPLEFFWVDFKDLPAMVQAWRQVGSPQWSPEKDAELAAAELESELEQEAQRAESNGIHSEALEPGSESQ